MSFSNVILLPVIKDGFQKDCVEYPLGDKTSQNKEIYLAYLLLRVEGGEQLCRLSNLVDVVWCIVVNALIMPIKSVIHILLIFYSQAITTFIKEFQQKKNPERTRFKYFIGVFVLNGIKDLWQPPIFVVL